MIGRGSVIRGRRDEQHGAATVELAILLPLLLLLLGGVIEIGLAAAVRTQLQEAAEEAALFAAQYPGNASLASTRGAEVARGTNLTAADVNIQCRMNNRRIIVTIDEYPHPLISPFGEILLRRESIPMSVEIAAPLLARNCQAQLP
jgi:hypothetical protein